MNNNHIKCTKCGRYWGEDGNYTTINEDGVCNLCEDTKYMNKDFINEVVKEFAENCEYTWGFRYSWAQRFIKSKLQKQQNYYEKKLRIMKR